MNNINSNEHTVLKKRYEKDSYQKALKTQWTNDTNIQESGNKIM